MGRTERLEQPKEFGKYQLVARLAQGRMGDVYKAKSHGVEGFEKVFCIKIMNPGLTANPQFVEALIDEAKRSVALSHANIAQVIDLGHEENQQRYYVAMEFIGGLDLARARRIANRFGYPWSHELSVFIASETAKALDYAHRRKDFNFQNLNILHRSLRPENIILSYDGEVKLTDFGLSRAMEVTEALDDEDVLSRILYAPPELFRGMPYTRQSDIFSLGLLFYEMLTGFHPYHDEDVEEVRRKAAAAQIPPISNYVEIPRPLQQILESMLVADPAGRAQSAGQLYEELIGYIFGNSLQADNRMLSMAMRELSSRDKSEEEIPPTAEAGLEEISHAELQNAFAAGGSLNTQNLPPSAVSALPSSRLGARSQPPAPGKALPGALGGLYTAAAKGQGKAALLTGRLGRGKEVLLDRLVDAVDERSDGSASILHISEDHSFRPFGVFSDLILRAVHQTLRESLDHRQQALQTLSEWGVPEEARQTMAALWDLQNTSTSTANRRKHFAAILWAYLQEFSRDGAFVLAIDRVERLDKVSFDALRDVIGAIENLPVLLVLSTQSEDGIRGLFEGGQPGNLEEIRVNGEHPPTPEELQEISDSAERLLTLLSLSDAPLLVSDAACLLGLSTDQLEPLTRELADAGALRIPRPDQCHADVPNYLTWRINHRQDGEESRLAATLARHLIHRIARQESDRLTPTLLRLYAYAADRKKLLRLAGPYGAWLESNGWQYTALEYYQHLGSLLGRHKLGVPQIRVGFILEAAQIALEMARLDHCRTLLEPLSALTETTRNETGFVRAQLLLGQLAMQQDDLDEARAHFKRSLQTARGLQNPELIARASLSLAGWYERFGDSPVALEYLESAANIYTRFGTNRVDLKTRADLLLRAARMWADRGMLRRAERPVSDLQLLANALPHPSIASRAAIAQARLASHRGELQEAENHYTRALELANAHGLAALAMELLRERAGLNIRFQAFEKAIACTDQIVGVAEAQGDYYSEQRARDLRALAGCHLQREVETSLEQLRLSLRRATERGVPKDVFRGHDLLAKALQAVGRTEEARHHRQHADRLGESMRISWAA